MSRLVIGAGARRVLADGYMVFFRGNLDVKESYRRKIAEEIAAAAGERSVDAVALDPDAQGVYLLHRVGGKVKPAGIGKRVSWDDVPDHILARLMLNSCARVEGLTADRNDTGHYYQVVSLPKDQRARGRKNPSADALATLRVFEYAIGRDMSVSVPIRTLTRRGRLKEIKPADNALWSASFRTNDVGGLEWVEDPTDDDYVMRSISSKAEALVLDTRMAQEDAPNKVSFLETVRRMVCGRFGEGAFSYQVCALEAWVEVDGPDKVKSAVTPRFSRGEVTVTSARPEDAEAARVLAERLGWRYSGRMSKKRPNVRVVPDLDPDNVDDGYGFYKDRVVQHMCLETALGTIRAKKPETMRAAFEKELAVKADVAAGRIAAFDWAAIGIDSFTCVQKVEVRYKRTLKEKKDVYASSLARLDVAGDGTMTFRLFEPHELDYGDELGLFIGEAMSDSDDGLLPSGLALCEITAGGRAARFSIELTGCMTLPNHLGEMLDDQESAPVSRARPNLADTLAGFFGIGAVRLDGDLCYYVGYSAKINQTLAFATLLRRVEGLPDELAPAFLRTLAPGLARVGQPTVLPIPLKYLREYAAREGRCEDVGPNGVQRRLFM